ncbi:sulfatase-like hydrolase/transferase, partial [bacterium]|nr:sulfatase-like hydrolase/transferase [bacterium]
CSKAANFKNLESHGHFASGQYRGSKADIWDGGHRVPFLVKWPKTIKAGSFCDTLTCQTDLMATCAELLGTKLPDTAGEDSESILPLFSGSPVTFFRKGIIHHSVSGHFAYRQGKWKLLLAKGSGGWTAPTEKMMAKIPDAPKGQLYDLEKDPGEENNLFLESPEIVESLLAQLKEDVANGRTTAGPKQPNDISVDKIKLWKGNVAK